MLTLNYDSWFVRKYLGYGKYHTPPKTVCELGRVFLGVTFLYLILAATILMFSGMYITTVFGLLYVLFTDNTFIEFFGFNSNEATVLGGCFFVFCVANVAALFAGSIIGYKWLKEYKANKRRKAIEKHYEETGSYSLENFHPSPITEFAKGIWERIHDKTCAMINWENDPISREAKQREADHARWLAEAKQYVKDNPE